jgi:hypothetical protein
VERRASLVELGLLMCLGCQTAGEQQKPHARPPSSAELRLKDLVLPPRAGRFHCEAEQCSQPYPRLPDAGEWRCADTGGVVWCAGGEPAAGVVAGPPDPSYRCGARFGERRERVCIDEHPDYPMHGADHYVCSFAQERGTTRVCKPGSPERVRPLAKGALAACWLDRDCRSGRCDRGTCTCDTDAACEHGKCRAFVCTEGP